MHSLFRTKGRAQAGATILDGIVAGLASAAASQGTGSGFVEKRLVAAALAMESMDASTSAELETSISGLSAALETIGKDHQIQFTASQMAAGAAAGVAASDIGAFLRAPVKHNVLSTESQSFIAATGADQFDRRTLSMEAYDERENKNAVVYSVAYNMQAARQDEFGEAFFPTVVVTPDQVGFSVSIRLVQVYDEVRRSISGKVNNFGKKNIIQAVVDPSILRNDTTKVIPVYRAESQALFVPSANVAPRAVNLEGTSITTSALAIGTKLSLLGISQTDALLETGLMDSTDSLDAAVQLEAIYVKIKGSSAAEDQVVKFMTNRLPTSVFNYSVQGNYRLMSLGFSTTTLLVKAGTLDVAGAAINELVPLADKAVRLGVSLFGTVNLETAETVVNASGVSVETVTDANGVQLDTASGTGQTIANVFAGATVIGYDLDARRSNTNRRERGQLLDVTFYNQVYAVPLRSPITVPRPLTAGDQNDSSDLAALITATHIRTSNAAVEELLRVKGALADYVNQADLMGATPDILGVARFLVKPFFEEKNLNVATAVNSLTSHERAADIQAVLVNQLRDMAYRMYRDSNYKAAADALAGGQSAVPTVIIGTDPVISRYLMVEGDLRTLGGEFNVKIVTTLNKNMAGKIVMSFGDFASGRDGQPNPMHFGNMAWKPELTLVLPLHRNGANSKELTVQPSFLHVTNLPIMAVVNVSGITDTAVSKVSVDFHSV